MESSLGNLIEELEESANQTDILPRELEFQLKTLGPKEKLIIEKHFYSHIWNVNSPKVLSLLRKAGMFSISIYIWKLENQDEIQGVLNDLLETEYSLLAEVIESSKLGTTLGRKLSANLEIAIGNLIYDLIEKPDLIIPNFMQILRKEHLDKGSNEYFIDNCTNALLNQHSTSLEEAITYQLEWNNESPSEYSFSLIDILSEICYDSENILRKLLDHCKNPNFSGWKYLLIILKFILCSTSSNQIKINIKQYLNELFSTWISRQSHQSLLLMMLIGRQLAYSSGSKKSEVYYDWYKFQIADMNYRFKRKDEFQYAVKTMTNTLIPFESDVDFLKIHAETAINAPPYCGTLVKTFKNLCKNRQTEILINNSPVTKINPEDVIIID